MISLFGAVRRIFLFSISEFRLIIKTFTLGALLLVTTMLASTAFPGTARAGVTVSCPSLIANVTARAAAETSDCISESGQAFPTNGFRINNSLYANRLYYNHHVDGVLAANTATCTGAGCGMQSAGNFVCDLSSGSCDFSYAFTNARGGQTTVAFTIAQGSNIVPAFSVVNLEMSPPPTVTAISPTSGPAAGATTVVITGTNFSLTSGAGGVKFGATNATSYTVNSPTQITATSPAGTGTVDVTVTSSNGTSTTSASDRYAYLSASTTTALNSSANPSQAGQSVTFTATVTTPGGSAAGTVMFNDNGTVIGTSTLSGGVATFTTSALTVGVHPITATYNGGSSFAASTSLVLNQTVNIPADSIKLRALQINTTKVIAQASGQAISGAIDSAIAEGFNDGGAFVTPGAGGVRFNFAAANQEDGIEQPPHEKNRSNAYSSDEAGTSGAQRRSRGSRTDDAFAAIDQQMPKKASMRKFGERSEWLFWIDLRGTNIDRWGSSTTIGLGATQASLYGQQLNLLGGLTYRVTPNFLVGVLGGYEFFRYTEQDVNGRLKGDGWTTGAYAGWKLTEMLRWDAAMAYSGIGYNGVAGTAQGNFNGNRWLASTGLTGTYKFAGTIFEPSAKIYALWESENAYTDSLGTLQSARNFSTGRASAGVKTTYPVSWTEGIVLAPYIGLYGDYYFTQDDANLAQLGGASSSASVPLLQGWSARASGGVSANLSGGAMLGLGGELGGIGNDTRVWTFTGRARVPFSAN